MLKTVEMDFEFMPTIKGPPKSPEDLHTQACSNDKITVEAWRKIWPANTRANHAKHGPFSSHSLGKYFNHLHLNPCIVAGAGPSLKNSIEKLKNRGGIPLISCLHNYSFMEDSGITPDFYVTLDAGAITIDEVAEGGKKTAEEYWASTKNKKLCAFIGSHPELINKWQGEILWFNAPIPDEALVKEIDEIEDFGVWVSSGGNVLGASFYIAKAIMGANPIIFVGADFSFSYNNKFHSYDTQYDKNIGNYGFAYDVYGNRVKTWGSYYNFKCWFESRFCSVPGLYINATEGGILGSYAEGNIEQIKQMRLEQVIEMYSLSEHKRAQCECPSGHKEKTILF